MRFELTDAELTDAWQAQTLGGTGISHIDHVRIAWVLVQRHGAEAAEERLVEGTRRACDHYGVPEKFNEPLTRRWAREVAGAVDRGPAGESFDGFIARNPELKRGDLFGCSHDVHREQQRPNGAEHARLGDPSRLMRLPHARRLGAKPLSSTDQRGRRGESTAPYTPPACVSS